MSPEYRRLNAIAPLGKAMASAGQNIYPRNLPISDLYDTYPPGAKKRRPYPNINAMVIQQKNAGTDMKT